MTLKINKTSGKLKSVDYMSKMLLFLIIGLLCCNWAGSQPVNLKADRPGFSTGTHAVTPGRLYLELGYQYSFNARNEFLNYSEIPDLNIRIGIADKLEMFVMWDGWSISHNGSEATNTGNGTEPGLPGLGAKYQLIRADGYNLTLLGLLEGTDARNSFSADPAIALVWDFELSARFELFGLAQGGSEAAAGGNNLSTRFAVGLGFAISDRLESFAEYYNIAYPGRGEAFGGSEFGLMYLLTPEIQLDIYGGYAFSREMDHYSGLGISRRF